MLSEFAKSPGSVQQPEQDRQLPVSFDHRQRRLDAAPQRGAFPGKGQQLGIVLGHGFLSIGSRFDTMAHSCAFF
jgi:hypothetical protein